MSARIITPSLDVGTVVKISQIKKEVLSKTLRLQEGMEGVVWLHNDVFKIDEESESDQQGPEGQKMYDFVMPGSKIRVGPIMAMPDDHKVVVWVVRGIMWNVTNVHVLFNGSMRWGVVRSGEILRLRGE
jgi:hypothetical protein